MVAFRLEASVDHGVLGWDCEEFRPLARMYIVRTPVKSRPPEVRAFPLMFLRSTALREHSFLWLAALHCHFNSQSVKIALYSALRVLLVHSCSFCVVCSSHFSEPFALLERDILIERGGEGNGKGVQRYVWGICPHAGLTSAISAAVWQREPEQVYLVVVPHRPYRKAGRSVCFVEAIGRYGEQ